jgi:hypothetical protein
VLRSPVIAATTALPAAPASSISALRIRNLDGVTLANACGRTMVLM